MATAMPKIIPTIINRLFIPKAFTAQLKIDCERLGTDMEEYFKGKIKN
jgi:hypothetical protein